MLCPDIRPYSIEAFFYLPRAVLVLLSCSTGSLCQSCLAFFFLALHTVHSLLALLPLVLEEHAGYFSPHYFHVISICFVGARGEVLVLQPACEQAHSLTSGVLQGCSMFGASWVVVPVCWGRQFTALWGIGHGAFFYVWYFSLKLT